MKLCLDVETTIFAKGNCYSLCNRLVSIHATDGTHKWSVGPKSKDFLQDLVNQASTLIWFNGKFDVGWLRKLGVIFPEKVKHYDVQLAHFYITNQQHKLPSLNDVAAYYNIPGKDDKVAAYWASGVDTPDIPWDILCEYGERDVELTHHLYTLQQAAWQASPTKHTLFKLACQDLLVLQEMEWNGLYFDEEKCYTKSEQLQQDIKQLNTKLSSIYPDVPINFNSNHQLSAFLYGGTVRQDGKELIGVFKGGQKAGQPKYKNITIEHQLPRIFTPLPKSEMAAPGVYATDEGTLRKLKGKKKFIVEWLLELAKLTKLDETYYTGLSSLNKEMNWCSNYLHGQFNQCIAKTGRLSSSKP